MSTTLSFASDIKVFPCPNCRETINTSMTECPYCRTAIDAAAASRAAEETSKISQACSDASYLRIMAWALLTFFGLMFVPLLNLLGVAGLWFLRFAIPFMVIRWWIRFGKIRTADVDFRRAKQSVIVVSIVATLGLLSFLNR
jgi:hypothetical protein